MPRLHRLLAVAALALTPHVSGAQVLAPIAYDMPNGTTGTFTYWDDAYNGSGCKTCSGAALSGGVGDLTNGIITTSNWNSTPGPFVGWTSDVSILFHFAVASTYNLVRVHFDGGGGTSVSPPHTVRIGADDGAGGFVGAQNYAVSLSRGAPFWATFDLSGLSSIQNGREVRMQFLRNTTFVMTDEVEFTGQAAVVATPEPSSVVLLATGLFGVVFAARRRGRRGTS